MRVNFAVTNTVNRGLLNSKKNQKIRNNSHVTESMYAPSFKTGPKIDLKMPQGGATSHLTTALGVPLTNLGIPSINLNVKKVLVLVFDGWGIPRTLDDLVHCPYTSNDYAFFDKLIHSGDVLFRRIEASGKHVGLPEGMVGSSEVGHNNIGAGRMVPQDLMIINNSLENGTFFANPVLLDAMRSAKEKDKTLHLMGLLSDGGVHSTTNHLYNLIHMAHANGVKDVRVHAFLDGRDVPEHSGKQYVAETNKVLEKFGYEPISSIMGMTYPMDRNSSWEKTEKAFKLLTDGRDYEQVGDVYAELDRQYADNIEDQAISPKRTMSYKPIRDEDSVVFFNYRNDRTIQLTDALTQKKGAAAFVKGYHQPENLNFVCMSLFKEDFNLPIAFKPEVSEHTLTEMESLYGNFPYIVCEKEKFKHVTSFFNGKQEKTFDGSSIVVFPSQKGPKLGEPYTPEMQAQYIVDAIKIALKNPRIKYIFANFANADMIGHNNSSEDARRTIRFLDQYVIKELYYEALKQGVAIIGTADHGNIENYKKARTRDDKNAFLHGHTNYPVGIFASLPGFEDDIRKGRLRFNDDPDAALKDVAPTVLAAQGCPQPIEMTGIPLFERKMF